MKLLPPLDEHGSSQTTLGGARERRIEFRHPGYLDRRTILSLPIFDDGGIDYEIALVACGALAGNRWKDSFFSVNGKDTIERPSDGILRERAYFFHLPGPLDPPYPIVPRFSDWRFPHNEVPVYWQNWADNTAVTLRPRDLCVATNYADGVDIAHLIPTSEDEWWDMNNMSSYTRTHHFSSRPIDSPANHLPLLADLHRVFGDKHLCFVPKAGEHGNATLVLHIFASSPSQQLPGLWHNRTVHPLPKGVLMECLFARFVWTIFNPQLFTFLLRPTESLRLLAWSRESHKQEVTDATSEMCQQIYTNSSSRSPKKRAAPQSFDSPVLDSYFDNLETSVSTLEDLSSTEEEATRGRPRKRRALDDHGVAFKKSQRFVYICNSNNRFPLD